MESCYRFFFFGYLIKFLYCGLLHVMHVVAAYNGELFLGPHGHLLLLLMMMIMRRGGGGGGGGRG